MKDQNTNNSTEEVDLGYLFNRIGGFFRGIVKLIFLMVVFFKKYIWITIGLIVVGIILGYFKDKSSEGNQVYENRIIVIPNFESVDYLYETVDELNAKVKYEDSVYLKSILGNQFKNLGTIEIEPIPDIYNFITKSQENIDVFRILFQNQDFTEFIEDVPTSKNYKYHKLVINVVGRESKSIIDTLLKNINNNTHFLGYKKEFQENTKLQLEQNALMLSQADSIIKSAVVFSPEKGGDQAVYISDGRLDMILFRKQELLDMRLKLQKKLNDEVEVIKLVSANYNVLNKSFLSFSNKVKYPILLVFLFSFFFFLRFTYRKLKAVAEKDE